MGTVRLKRLRQKDAGEIARLAGPGGPAGAVPGGPSSPGGARLYAPRPAPFTRGSWRGAPAQEIDLDRRISPSEPRDKPRAISLRSLSTATGTAIYLRCGLIAATSLSPLAGPGLEERSAFEV